MNIVITGEINAATAEVKGLSVLKATHLKTKTKVEVKVDKENVGCTDFYAEISKDMRLLKAQGAAVTVIVTAEGIPALGRIINRSVVAMGKVAISMSEIGWDDAAGVISITGNPLNGTDFAAVADVVIRLCRRAMTAVSGTHHPLTLFDLKQSAGIAFEASQGNASAEALKGWFDIRELTVLEATKEAKAALKAAEKAKASAPAAKAAPKVSKASPKAPAPAPEKNAPKPKAPAKAAAKKTAALGNLTE